MCRLAHSLLLLLVVVASAQSQQPVTAADYIDRGLSGQLKKDFDGAIADYTKAIELNPKSALAFHNRAILRHEPRSHSTD